MNRFLKTILLICLVSCHHAKHHKNVLSLKDNVIKYHLLKVSLDANYDTDNIDFKLLRAYENNDTLSLITYYHRQREIDSLVTTVKYKGYAVYPDSCIHEQGLNNSFFQEVYRFKYIQSYCPYKINATVGKYKDSAILHFILYRSGIGELNDSSSCKIVSNIYKKITISQWNEIKDAIAYSDFWNLKPYSYLNGLDGATLIIEGYLNEPSKVYHSPSYHLVNRWFGRSTAISKPFDLVLKISGIKKGCIWFK